MRAPIPDGIGAHVRCCRDQAPVFGRPGLTGVGTETGTVGVTVTPGTGTDDDGTGDGDGSGVKDTDGLGVGVGVGASQLGWSFTVAKVAEVSFTRVHPSGNGPPI